MTVNLLRAAVCLALLSSSLRAKAQVSLAAADPPPDTRTFEQYLNDIKKPLPWFSWGADFRVRNEYFYSAITLSSADPKHEQDLVRFRGRLWTVITPVTNMTFNARVAAEPRLWINNAFAKTFSDSHNKGKTGMEWRYGIIDQLNVKWANVLDQPLSISAGRQDIALGDFYDWWLVLDGTPMDGSWTTYLDSARVTYELMDLKTKLDLIYIQQQARPDDGLPLIGANPDPNYSLTEQNERGVVVYLSNKSLENTQIDSYFIYKHDDREFSNGDNADIYTAGAKVTGTPIDHWSYSVEGAYQFGWKEDALFPARDISAYGGKAKLAYALSDRFKNQFSLAGEYLSGDDPDTQQDEMFDLLWGRWPRWSELYIYSYANETMGRIGQINNIWRVGPSWSMSPMKGMTAGLTYNALFAPQDVPTRTTAPRLFSDDGNFRGHFVQAVLKYQFSKLLQGHLWWETIWEGDYYAQHDSITFLRGEIFLTF